MSPSPRDVITAIPNAVAAEKVIRAGFDPIQVVTVGPGSKMAGNGGAMLVINRSTKTRIATTALSPIPAQMAVKGFHKI